MVSEKTLGIIVTVCITAVVTAAVIKVGESHPKMRNPLTVTPSSTVEAPDYGTSFYDTSIDEIDTAAKAVSVPPSIQKRQIGIPGLSASSYLVGNVSTGEIYFEHNSTRVLPVASMSKLVTAFVATDMLAGTSTVEISTTSMMAPPDKSNLQVNERYSLDEILYPLLLNSSNVAAEAVSSTADDRAGFLEAMSSYAWEIGMPDTYFADPSGVDPRNAATARDIFALSRYLFQYRPDILALTRTASSSTATTTEHGSHEFSSTHPFVKDPRFIGGKTGKTPEAGETMMTVMNMGGTPVAIVVLASENREADTRILLGKVQSIIDR